MIAYSQISDGFGFIYDFQAPFPGFLIFKDFPSLVDNC